MVYIITQTKGILAMDAKELRDAVRNQDRETAVNLLIKHNGLQYNHLGELLHDTPDGYPELTYTDRNGNEQIDPWWLYNADGAISRKIDLTDTEYIKIYNKYKTRSFSKAYHMAIVEKLQAKFPGTEYRIDYEY